MSGSRAPADDDARSPDRAHGEPPAEGTEARQQLVVSVYGYQDPAKVKGGSARVAPRVWASLGLALLDLVERRLRNMDAEVPGLSRSSLHRHVTVIVRANAKIVARGICSQHRGRSH
jgi:hypothetical protein